MATIVGLKVKVIAKKEDLPLKASEYAGAEGVVTKEVDLTDRKGGAVYYPVLFPNGDKAAYLASELEVIA